jgi:hypothetical protein
MRVSVSTAPRHVSLTLQQFTICPVVWPNPGTLLHVHFVVLNMQASMVSAPWRAPFHSRGPACVLLASRTSGCWAVCWPLLWTRFRACLGGASSTGRCDQVGRRPGGPGILSSHMQPQFCPLF